MLDTNSYMPAVRTAGNSTGSVTWKKVPRGPAFETRAASSRLGSIIRKEPTTMRKMVVTPLSPSRKISPPME
jgi:hypothetical protein